MTIVLPQMTVSISDKQRKQTVRYNQSPFVNDIVVSLEDPKEQIIVNIALIFDLKAAGIKVFMVLAWILQNKLIRTNAVLLDKAVLRTFLAAQERKLELSPTTFFRGIAELEKAGIIAKQDHRAWYFINPNFVFSNKPIVFTNDIKLEE
ncbi:hypothetical protein [Bartonella harrusi]|uniref:Plasmid replication protein RepL domain-containing protein n=1 Tax=Bartonella harrusi TaxID=2961895 RepID=A0ABY5ER04_9HYPH|nr:hypothetical protein [Bartonella harrusi]UTO27682.1 hypothetical protein NMK50_00075 [Bartonella harrusi]